MDPPASVEDTFLTERQSEVLTFRYEGLTQREVAERLGTSVANVSGIEAAARRNVEAARRTVTLAKLLGCSVRFRAPAGQDLRELVDDIYDRGDESGLRVAYAEPELTTRLHDLLGEQIESRRIIAPIEVGLTAEGEVVAFPSDAEDGG